MSHARSLLIGADGRVRQGIFASPIDEVNFRDFPLRTPMGKPAGWWLRRFGFNQFQFLGALCDDLVFGCALADIKYAATAFVYFFEPSTRRLAEHSFQSPLARGIEMDQFPETGQAAFHARGLEIEMTSGASPAFRHLRVRLPNGDAIDAHFDEQDPPQQPMRICTRAGANGWVFARKTAGMPASGTVTWGDKTLDLADSNARGHCDWSAGYMRRETFWNWGCLAGTTSDGRALGMNVSCGVNETSFTENCFWLDGILHKLDTVAFDYDPGDLMQKWRLTSGDGRLQLEFTPAGRHIENLDVGLVASNFNQLFGRYRGSLTTRAGELVQVESMLGYAESHYAKW